MGSSTAESVFEVLYRDHHAHVLAYCRRRTNDADADDATAEVFTVAWRRIADVPRGDRARYWLYGAAYRVLSNQWRSADRRRNLVDRVGRERTWGDDPEDTVVRSSESRQVLDAVKRLAEPDQEILRLAGWEGLSHRAIAQVLDISEDAAAQRFSRAKKRLADEYDRSTDVRPPDAQKGEER